MIVFTFAILVIGIPPFTPPGGDSSLRARVDAELAPNLEHLGATITDGVSGVVSQEIWSPPRVKKADGRFEADKDAKALVLGRKRDYIFEFSGLNSKEVSRYDDSMMHREVERVVCQTRDLRFVAKNPGKGGAYVLSGFSHPPKKNNRWRDSISWKLVSAPFAIDGYEFKELMRHPSFSIRGVAPVERGGKACVKIDYQLNFANPPRGVLHFRSGWVIVSPDDQWAIQEASCGWEQGIIHMIVNYPERPIGAVPVPSKVTNEFSRPDSTNPDSKTVFILKDFAFKRIPDRDFTLAYYGLSDVDKPPPTRSRWATPFLFIGLAVLALVLSLVLRYMASRRQRASAA